MVLLKYVCVMGRGTSSGTKKKKNETNQVQDLQVPPGVIVHLVTKDRSERQGNVGCVTIWADPNPNRNRASQSLLWPPKGTCRTPKIVVARQVTHPKKCSVSNHKKNVQFLINKKKC